MRNSDRAQFANLLTGVGELYSKTMSRLLVDVYWQALTPFDFQDVLRVFQAHIHNPDGGQFFPKPADIVRLIEGSGETRALQAWAIVEKAIVHIGAYQSVVFDDPLIHAVLEDMGGWIKLCHTLVDEMPFRANEFQKRYRGFVNRAPVRHPKYCCGIAEGENLRHGYPATPRLIVGDIQKAEQVMLSGGGIPLCIHSSELMESWAQRLPQVKNNNTDTEEISE
jgi:hypothetical protein